MVMNRHRIVLVTLLLIVSALGVAGQATAAGGPGSPVGVWQGEEGGPNNVMTFVIEQDDAGNYPFFVLDSFVGACDGKPGAMWGRGQQVNAPEGTFYMLFWDGIYCVDGTRVPFPDAFFKLWADQAPEYIQLDPEQYGGDWFGYPLCDPGFDDYVPEAMNVIMGTEEADTIKGTRNADLICAFGGDDVIRGFGGDDIIVGAEGADEVYGGTGMDILWGDTGNDVLYGGFHTDGVFGNDGDDEVRPQASADYGYGGNGADIMDGFFGHDWLDGGPGDDDAWGRNGNDDLLGGSGDDFLSGGAGPRDTADGEDGRDTCNAETETNCEF
jgi:Ca2+-binding RTX toxin-like protein